MWTLFEDTLYNLSRAELTPQKLYGPNIYLQGILNPTFLFETITTLNPTSWEVQIFR